MGDEMDRISSLPVLQGKIKRDPIAYEKEFLLQYNHFQSQLEIFRTRVQKPAKHFNELVMFLAHVSPLYPEKKIDYAQTLIDVLQEYQEQMHGLTRRNLVQSLMLLRNRGQFPCVRTLPVYFKLFKSKDKLLRTNLVTHIVRDITKNTQKGKHGQKVTTELQQFFHTQLKGTEYSLTRKAVAILITLAYKHVWFNAHAVNIIASATLCPDLKVAAAAANFLLGNKSTLQKDVMSDDDDDGSRKEVLEELQKVKKGQRKTRKKLKKMSRAKKACKRLIARKEQRTGVQGVVNFAAIDLLHDPHSLAEKLLSRVQGAKEAFAFRILMMQLVARLIGRHQLIMLNYYPTLQRYLQPKQKQVTVFLACLAQACHEEVPPSELTGLIQHLMTHFIAESIAAEVVAVGLNCIREICIRQPAALTAEQLNDLSQFRKFKDKGVVAATRALINWYRETNAEMLHKSLRGKEAQLALARGEIDAPVFGKKKTHDTVPGLELLQMVKAAKKAKEDDADTSSEEASLESEDEQESEDGAEESGEESIEIDEDLLNNVDEDTDAESGDEEGGEASGGEGEGDDEVRMPPLKKAKLEAQKQAEALRKKRHEKSALMETLRAQSKQEAATIGQDQILSNEDFHRIRKLQIKQAFQLQVGRKRTKADLYDYDFSETESENEGAASDGEAEESSDDKDDPAQAGVVTAESLKFFSKNKKKDKQARMAAILKGREDKARFKKRARKGGKTNKENARGKPMMMVVKGSHSVRRKDTERSSTQKVSDLRKHIKTLKMKTGGVAKRRR